MLEEPTKSVIWFQAGIRTSAHITFLFLITRGDAFYHFSVTLVVMSMYMYVSGNKPRLHIAVTRACCVTETMQVHASAM